MIEIARIFVTQRQLRNVVQLAGMVGSIEGEPPPEYQDDALPPITLNQYPDDSIDVEDGHHRLLSHWLSGKDTLEKGEYILVQLERRRKKRAGTVVDLIDRVRNQPEAADESVSRALTRRRSSRSGSFEGALTLSA